MASALPSSSTHEHLSYPHYLALVFPFIISTMTTPLLGAVDTALVGHLPDAAYIGGVAIGAVIFNTLYWLFGFLRVSTTGFTAQALNNNDKLLTALLRPLVIALLLGLLFVVLQKPIFNGAIRLLEPAHDVQYYASQYFYILIWGAPFTLINYVCLGWLMGHKKVKAVLINQISVNLLNIFLAVLFVYFLKWRIIGLAFATLIAQIMGTIFGFVLIKRSLIITPYAIRISEIITPKALKKVMLVNSDLIIRTLCLLIVTNHFISIGSSFGTDVLAANAILFQIHYLIAYLFDGFANASSVYSGRAKGHHDTSLYQHVLCYTTVSTLWSSLLLALLWWLYHLPLITLFTEQAEVIALCLQYQIWITLFPIVGSCGIIFYGIFSGLTYTSPIRNSMLLALFAWFIAWYIFIPAYGNHGLWISYLIFSMGRSLFLLPCLVLTKKQLVGSVD